MFHLTVKLVRDDSVLVNDRAQDQIIRLLLDELVSIRANLIETGRGTHAEDGLPRTAPRQTVVQLVGELQAGLVVLVVWVVVKVTTGESSQVCHRLQVLEDALTHGDDEQVN